MVELEFGVGGVWSGIVQVWLVWWCEVVYELKLGSDRLGRRERCLKLTCLSVSQSRVGGVGVGYLVVVDK